MLIDEFLPIYDFDEKHEITIRASAEKVSAALESIDFNESTVIRWLLRLRGLSAKDGCDESPKTSTLRDMTKSNFVILGEKPNEEILLGIAGKFWTPAGDVQKLDAKDFAAFNKEGYAKAAWNFTLSEVGEKEVCLKTETRVQCLGAATQESFRFYWWFIKPFSGWIRQEMLRLVKQKAEAAA
ncbi:MAG TPA: hypothetical protein VF721_24360 [Pyrinomonadaceae bacterium]|jgi:hypothetical protein